MNYYWRLSRFQEVWVSELHANTQQRRRWAGIVAETNNFKDGSGWIKLKLKIWSLFSLYKTRSSVSCKGGNMWTNGWWRYPCVWEGPRLTVCVAAPLGDWETFTGPDVFIGICKQIIKRTSCSVARRQAPCAYLIIHHNTLHKNTLYMSKPTAYFKLLLFFSAPLARQLKAKLLERPALTVVQCLREHMRPVTGGRGQ